MLRRGEGPFPPKRRFRVTRAAFLPVAVGAVVGCLAVRLSVQVARELLEHGASRAQLQTVYTTIPGPAGKPALRIRSLFARGGENRLPPIVLVHGFGIASSYFVPLAARLGRNAHVHVPELPGHGRSDHDERPLDVPELAEAMAGWAEATGLDPFVLIGHSMGCQVAAEFAWRYRERTRGLLLIGPTSDPAARTVPRQLGRLAASALFERPSLALWLAVDYTRAGLRVLWTEARSTLTHHLEDHLPKIRVAAQVVRGERDAVAPERWTRTVARLLDSPAPKVIPRSGHAVHYADPAAVAEVALAFVRSLALSDPPRRR